MDYNQREQDSAKDNGSFYKLTALDVIVIVLILSLSTVFILREKVGLSFQSTEASSVRIFQDGKLFKQLKLAEDQEIGLVGGKMLLEIKAGRIRVKESDCPRQICVNAGWIKHPGETVVCVPYKTLIEINSPGPPVLDAVVH